MDDEGLLLPTEEAIKTYETNRADKNLSEHTALVFMRKALSPVIFDGFTTVDTNKVVIYQDLEFRQFYSVGRGLEYKFSTLSFRTVIVGYQYFGKKTGMKRATWNNKFYVGIVGPMVWKVGGKDTKKYVVVFSDKDRRRFTTEQLTPFLVGELDEEVTVWNTTLNIDK